MFRIIEGDCREVMQRLCDAGSSYDAIVTDPPYELGFMGKAWDRTGVSFQSETWALAFKLLKPGGHMLAFGGSRTYHRIACAIEDAGFEIRDHIMWVYGSGFPKSRNVSKAIDEEAGYMRGTVPDFRNGPNTKNGTKGDKYSLGYAGQYEIDAGPITEAARQWQGWGTALKPSFEPLIYATRPLKVRDIIASIGSKVDSLGASLWLMLSVNTAENLFASSRCECEAGAERAFVQWSVAQLSNSQGDLLGQMDMSQSDLATLSILSTVASWRNTLAALLSDGSMSTIEMESKTTIDWKTLSFCLSEITPACITQGANIHGGLTAHASPAVRYFNAELLKLTAIHELSVLGPAISQWQANSLDDQERARFSHAHEPIVLARKPLVGTVAENILKYGTGALNVDGCRVGTGADKGILPITKRRHADVAYTIQPVETDNTIGRWPANLIHDGSDEVEAAFAVFGERTSSKRAVYHDIGRTHQATYSKPSGRQYTDTNTHGDTGTASRFFYCAKASRADRDDGLAGMLEVSAAVGDDRPCGDFGQRLDGRPKTIRRNNHPTVKPTALMRYLCRLITPPGGVILDPFAGSGSTGRGALLEGFGFVGIEAEAQWVDIAQRRVQAVAESPQMATFI